MNSEKKKELKKQFKKQLRSKFLEYEDEIKSIESKINKMRLGMETYSRLVKMIRDEYVSTFGIEIDSDKEDL